MSFHEKHWGLIWKQTMRRFDFAKMDPLEFSDSLLFLFSTHQPLLLFLITHLWIRCVFRVIESFDKNFETVCLNVDEFN